jgi:Rrf2 family protein
MVTSKEPSVSANSKLTVAIHILSFLTSSQRKRPDAVTSEQIAYSVNTNPVVIRRLLGLLQKSGIVDSHRGAHAGWTLARQPSRITLLDVYNAVVEDPLFAMHASTPNQKCPIGRGIQPALTKVYGELEDRLRAHLARTSVEEVLCETIGPGTKS